LRSTTACAVEADFSPRHPHRGTRDLMLVVRNAEQTNNAAHQTNNVARARFHFVCLFVRDISEASCARSLEINAQL
jgi:hypothetical protein